MDKEKEGNWVFLTPRDSYLMIMMRWIDAQGGWDLKCGRLEMNFNDKNEIGSITITKNHRPEKEAIDFQPKIV